MRNGLIFGMMKPCPISQLLRGGHKFVTGILTVYDVINDGTLSFTVGSKLVIFLQDEMSMSEMCNRST